MNEILGQRISDGRCDFSGTAVGGSVVSALLVSVLSGPFHPQLVMDDESVASVFVPEDGVGVAFASAYDNTMSDAAAAATTASEGADTADAAADADANNGGPVVPPKQKSSSKKKDEAAIEAATCEQWYERNNASKQCLMAMCIGLGSKDGRVLGDHTEGPYGSCKTKSHVKPTRPTGVARKGRESPRSLCPLDASLADLLC